MSEVIVACDGLMKQYGTRTVVDDLCLRIDAGTVYGLLGPNGAGKTTTIAMLCGILPPSGGQATVCGRPVRASCNAKNRSKSRGGAITR